MKPLKMKMKNEHLNLSLFVRVVCRDPSKWWIWECEESSGGLILRQIRNKSVESGLVCFFFFDIKAGWFVSFNKLSITVLLSHVRENLEHKKKKK